MYMTRFDENDNHGSVWVWCSGCKNYSHYQYLIPDDYKNFPTMDEEELFLYCRKMTSVTLNDGLKVIGCEAFSSCSSLTTINLPSSITIIDDIAFEGCSSLQSLTLPNGLKEVRLMLVENCSNLEYLYIPNSITKIYRNAFYNCPKLTAIHYGGTVSEWNTFASENYGWNINSSIINVICTDGEVDI